MSHVIRAAATDQIALFRAYDTDGTAKVDLTSSTTGLALSVFRIGASAVSISSLSNKAADDTTHADGAIRQVQGNLYSVDLPDAACATQVASIVVKGAYTGGVIEGVPHPIVAYSPTDAAGLGLSRIDAAVSSRAEPGDEMDLVDAPNLTAVAAIQDGLSTFDPLSDEVDVGSVEGTDATDYFTSLLTAITISITAGTGTVTTAITAGTNAVLAKLLNYVRLMTRKDAAAATDAAAELIEINDGDGTFDNADDALEAIRDRGDDAWITGAGGGGGGGEDGGVSVTIPLTDQDANPIADARVWITSDADGDTIVDGAYRTDDAGEVTFTLLAGETYYVWAKKAGQMAVNGQSIVAVAD